MDRNSRLFRYPNQQFVRAFVIFDYGYQRRSPQNNYKLKVTTDVKQLLLTEIKVSFYPRKIWKELFTMTLLKEK